MDTEKTSGLLTKVAFPSGSTSDPLLSVAHAFLQQVDASWVEVVLEDPEVDLRLCAEAGEPPSDPNAVHTVRLMSGDMVCGKLRMVPITELDPIRVQQSMAVLVPLLAAHRDMEISRLQLQRDKGFLTGVINGIAQPLYVKAEASRCYLAVNDAFCEVSGRTRDAVKGQPDEMLHTSDAAARLRSSDDDAFSVGRADIEEEDIAPDGTRRTFLTSKRVTSIGGQRVLVGVRTEVTGRKSVEHAIATAREAKEESRVKSAFLETMSHELRTPLNAILGLSEILSASELTDQQRKLLDTVRTSGGTLLALLNDVLDFTRLLAGNLEIADAAVDVERVVERVLKDNLDDATSKGLDIWCTLSGDLPLRIRSDPQRLQQILHHLVRNAIKFTSEGHVHIDARASKLTTGETAVNISVRDTGRGLHQQAQEWAFEPFVQGDGTIRRRIGGAGLGLAICDKLATALQGELTMDSAPGIGSTFRILLPCQPGHLRSHRPLTGRIGLVHTNAPWRYALKHMLRSWGLDVFCHGSIDRLRDPVDVLITDAETAGLAADARGTSIGAIIAVVRDDGTTLRHTYDSVIAWPCLSTQLRASLEPLLLRRITESPEDLTPQRRLEGARVLVVEDNVVNRLVAQRMLEEMGCIVESVPGGREALTALEQGVPDVILMDLHMPDMDGWATTTAIRQLGERGALVPITAVTASASIEVRERCLSNGMNAFLSKPISMASLETTLKALIPTDTADSGWS